MWPGRLYWWIQIVRQKLYWTISIKLYLPYVHTQNVWTRQRMISQESWLWLIIFFCESIVNYQMVLQICSISKDLLMFTSPITLLVEKWMLYLYRLWCISTLVTITLLLIIATRTSSNHMILNKFLIWATTWFNKRLVNSWIMFRPTMSNFSPTLWHSPGIFRKSCLSETL